MMKEQVLQKENPWGRVVRLRLSYLNMQFNIIYIMRTNVTLRRIWAFGLYHGSFIHIPFSRCFTLNAMLIQTLNVSSGISPLWKPNSHWVLLTGFALCIKAFPLSRCFPEQITFFTHRIMAVLILVIVHRKLWPGVLGWNDIHGRCTNMKQDQRLNSYCVYSNSGIETSTRTSLTVTLSP